MDPLLQSTLETVHSSGNSFGETEAQARALDRRARLRGEEHPQGAGRAALVRRRLRVVRPAQPAGRAGRSPRSSTHAGVDFGLLFDGERNAGLRRPPGRRGGALRDARRGEHQGDLGLRVRADLLLATRTATTRLKNEYPSFGGNWTVLHHSELLLELHRVRPASTPARPPRLPRHLPRPLHLGRYNGVYDAPRRRPRGDRRRARRDAAQPRQLACAAAPAAAGSG